MTREIVRPAQWWREVDRKMRAAVALDPELGSAYEHAPTCACPVCVRAGERLQALAERIEAETRQTLICEVHDDGADE